MNLRITDVLYRLRLFFIPYLLILSSCLIIKLLFTREQIYYSINSYHNDLANQLFIYATDLGSGFIMIVLTIILLLYSYRTAFLLVTSFGITTILVQVVKRIVKAPRPSLYFEHNLSHIYFVPGVKMLMTNSFPSGHTVQAFTVAVVLAYTARQKRWGFIYLLLALAVGYSRMYLSEHFFEDVVAGSIIGTVATVIWLTIIDGKPFLHQNKWKRGLLKQV
ncbi:phosphatase PAP2 family protein [Mucilaginibacter sp. KACC 22063]|uniref:phosphatase PAP2 family protein n=1 Tax=Mucilaginibacter sp. KACC 22063 TaxID=3025666 RepID=UPI0023663034|nr:phosphatase PAP2 family protein [Mucilaginibacter sp. KACC 22063]WDF56818.1 phosphatase PAP2 family protein [Mucilaginibacter sp. KACC 22063]